MYEVVQTLQLCSDKDPLDLVGDLSVCLDGMQVDPETFAIAVSEHGKETTRTDKPNEQHDVDQCDCYIGMANIN